MKRALFSGDAIAHGSSWDPLRTAQTLIAAAIILSAAIFAGMATSRSSVLVLVTVGAIAVIGIALVNLELVERTITWALLLGGFVLGYGFANLGIPGQVPLPATEILFLPLAAVALLLPGTRVHGRILLPVVLFSIVVFARLAIDYPTWGVFAIRDATIGIEVFLVVVGYRAAMRDGAQVWIRRMGILMSLVLFYGGLLFPWRKLIEELGPTVGLQRPVPLLDPRGTKFAVIAAALYFLTFSRGWKRLVAVALVVGLVGAFQARTLYILLPLSIILLGWARRQQLRTLLRLVPVVALAAVVVAGMASLSIEGRRGPIDTDFIAAHAGTLLGRDGPMAGSIKGRKEWFRRTVDEVTKSPTSIAFGVGLGPDLTFGMLKGDQDQAVRKPHDDYLEVFARLGVLGFVLLVWMLLALLVPIVRKARSGDGPDERLCAWLFAACAVYLGVAGAQPLMSFPYGSIPLFFMLGMGAAVATGRAGRTSDGDGRHAS